MMSKLHFKQWLAEMAPPIVGGGGAGANAQKEIEKAISQAEPGKKVDAAQQAVEKMANLEKGQATSVKDNITLAAAQDKIAKEVGNMGINRMKKKMTKK